MKAIRQDPVATARGTDTTVVAVIELVDGGERTMKTAWIILTISMLSLLLSLPVLAQTASTGALTGEITDPHGAIVPGAQVLLVNETTGEKREVVSNDAGIYVVALLL